MPDRYISAEWIEPAMSAGGERMIKAIGDDGRVYFLPGTDPSTYDVPPWPQYLAEGGTIAPAGGDPTTNITSAPDDLTGGPTLGDVYNGN